jgi:transposase InsO family protein
MKASKFSDARKAFILKRGQNVVRTPGEACRRVGYPKTIRVDQGSEFVSRDLDLWAYARGVTPDFSRPGKPTDNAFALRREYRSTGSIPFPSSPSTAASGASA